MDSYDISASALSAQRFRLDVIASNLANMNTTRQADGKIAPYLRKNVVFGQVLDAQTNAMGGARSALWSSANLKPSSFQQSSQAVGANHRGWITSGNGEVTLKAGISNRDGLGGVEVSGVVEDTKTPTRKVYDPSHPDANSEGYVELPNINPVTEMVDMVSATRAYEANVTAMQANKSMDKASLEI